MAATIPPLTQWPLHKSTKADPTPTPTLHTMNDAQRENWFGDPAYNEDMERAWAWISKAVAERWPGKTLKVNPGITGLHLMQYDLPVTGKTGEWYVYQPLPADIIRIIKQHSPQHRYEEAHLTTDRVVYYDMRDAYASLLGYGIPAFTDPTALIHDNDKTLVEHADGFYLCRIKVPNDWHHIGLVPAHPDEGKGWRYPNTPGEVFETWIDDHDVRMLQKHGWQFYIKERIILNSSSSIARPLAAFAGKIVPMLELAERARAAEATRTRNYVRNALRNMVNFAIGMMHKMDVLKEVDLALLDEDPDVEPVTLPSGALAAKKRVQHSPFRMRWYQPHWSSAVYRREIRRVTAQIVDNVSYEDVLCIVGDGVYLRTDPAWESPEHRLQQKVGAFRCKANKDLHRVLTFPNRLALQRMMNA
jgi:hypothetical protein